MPGKRRAFKDSKVAEFIQMLLEAAKEGRELTSKDLQHHFGFDATNSKVPSRWGAFKTYTAHKIESMTGGKVKFKSRRVYFAAYRLEGDLTLLEAELELARLSDEERQNLIRWAIQEKLRQQSGK